MSGLVRGWSKDYLSKIKSSLEKNKIKCITITGADPNSPQEDVYRISNEIAKNRPDVIIAFGGGSTIDAVKAASVLAAYTPDQVMDCFGVSIPEADKLDSFYGENKVTAIAEMTGVYPIPLIAIQTVASSAAHLSKYANITNMSLGQKKLIIDKLIIPKKAIFDFRLTLNTSKFLTCDGAMDGICHLWEVFIGAGKKEYYPKTKELALIGISLIVENIQKVIADPNDIEAREALCYATDLGGYAIMTGGTNGGHLGSFSLVDMVPHGRACAILNPYYMVLFANSIREQLLCMGEILKKAGFITKTYENFEGRFLGEVVADGFLRFLGSIDYPTNLYEIGVTNLHLRKMVTAAKDPELVSKLINMPIPLNPDKGDIETYMRPVLRAAHVGDFSLIRTMDAHI